LCTNIIIDNYYNLQTQKYGVGVARPMLAYFQSSNQRRFYVGAGGSAPQIQKLADRSDVISEVPKCTKIKFSGAPSRTPLGKLTALPQTPNLWGGAHYPRQEPHPALGPSGLVSMGLRAQPITELATVLMTDFK